MLIAIYFTGWKVTLSVEVASIVSFIIAICCELIRNKGNNKVLDDTEAFFKGMANGISIVALFFAMVPLMVPLAQAAGISPIALSVPMGLAGNLMRAVSPVAAVTVIVAGSVKKPALEVVRRTAVPMIGGVIFMFILSMILFL